VVGSITGITLINADNDATISAFTDGATIDLGKLPTKNINFRVATTGTIGSMRFGFDGNPAYAIENTAPYSLAGDVNGKFRGFTPTAGQHTLYVTPFISKGATGAAGVTVTVHFNVIAAPVIIPPVVTDLILFSSDSGQQVGSIADGETIDLTLLFTRRLNVQATTTGTAGSVRFDYDGATYRIENSAPFTLAGESAGPIFNAFPFTVGTHVITATPFSGTNATGLIGTSRTVHLTVLDSGAGG
jgi:hypothetical protein